MTIVAKSTGLDMHVTASDQSLYTYEDYKIESVSDVLNLVQQPAKFFHRIMDVTETDYNTTAPLGRTDAGFPRPYPFGIWFRGHADQDWYLNPEVFRVVEDREERFDHYDEKHMFQDLKLRSGDFSLEDNTDLDLLSLMKHHGLPTRLLDWSENILVALFFAVSSNYENCFLERPSSNDIRPARPKDAALYVMNAYRLNAISSLIKSPGIMNPNSLDVSLRTAQAEHIYIEDVIQSGDDALVQDGTMEAHRIMQVVNGSTDRYSRTRSVLLKRLRNPIALLPKRKHARMTAQLSTFTVHGGKALYPNGPKNQTPGYSFIDLPETLHSLNVKELKRGHKGKPFVWRFIISGHAVKRIMIELDRIGITEPVIYPDLERQITFMKRRWGVGKSERVILDLPLLNGHFGSRESKTPANYQHGLYGSHTKEEGYNASKLRKSQLDSQ